MGGVGPYLGKISTLHKHRAYSIPLRLGRFPILPANTPASPFAPAPGPSPTDMGPLVTPIAARPTPQAAPPNSDNHILLTPLGPMGPLVATPSSTASALFTFKAAVLLFRKSAIPPIAQPVSFNDDLHLGPFRPRKLAWSGEQRRGISTHITDAASIQDHVQKAMGQEFSCPEISPYRWKYQTLWNYQ